LKSKVFHWQVVNGLEDFNQWLSQLEKEIPSETKALSSAELFQLKGRYQTLKDKVDERTESFRQLNEIGKRISLSVF